MNDEVELEIAGRQRLVAIVTHESAEKLGLRAGGEAFALTKASSIIINSEEQEAQHCQGQKQKNLTGVGQWGVKPATERSCGDQSAFLSSLK